MNVEFQTRTVQTDQPCEFIFRNPVKHYIVGFSAVNLSYPDGDHHVSKIKIDLTKTVKTGYSVTITPKLRMMDSGQNRQSPNSSITIVILATTGPGNSALYMKKRVQSMRQYPFTWIPNINVFSTISYTKIRFDKTDHHLKNYKTSTWQSRDHRPILLVGEAVATDSSNHAADGEVMSSALCYFAYDQNILYQNFTSTVSGVDGDIDMGSLPNGTTARDYQLVWFINQFALSFADRDHHVKQFEVSSQARPRQERNRHLIVNLQLKSNLTDGGMFQKTTDIPHNSISGFILAINRHPRNDTPQTLEEFIRSYNQISSDLHRTT